MHQAAQAIERDPALRERLASRVRHVIVDEYQDVNPVQERIVRNLADLGARIVVVGDDDQTIYQWRGSDVHNILSFAERYSPVEQVRLQENFRSSTGVIETARRFIEQNTDRLPKAMRPTDAQPYEDGDLVALAFTSPAEEAAFIVDSIRQLRGASFDDGSGQSRGLAYSDMAVLLRSVQRNAGPVTSALKSAGIPFIVGGMTTLFDTLEAQAARQLFLYLAYWDGVDEASVRAAWEAAELGLDPARLRACE
jgi:DNA helicase-2/ATP-dependent DNA helicase PcrA